MAANSYNTPRARAWRNLMVLAINEALTKGLITVQDDGKRVPDSRFSSTFDFRLPDGTPVTGRVSDAGYGEVAVNVWVAPKPKYAHLTPSFPNGRRGLAEVEAGGWLERRNGAWLQTPHGRISGFRGTREMTRLLDALVVEPNGYLDRGKFMF